MTSSRRICLIRDAFDCLGGDRGIDAAARASVLLDNGFDVHLLYAGLRPSARVWSGLEASWSALGLRIHSLGENLDSTASLRSRSYAIHRWLIETPFEIADFDDDGSAFYAAFAKCQGLAHRETTITVVTSIVPDGRLDEAETFVESSEFLQGLFMQEQSLSLADIVFCDFEHTAQAVRKRRSGSICVGPPPALQPTRKASTSTPIKEIVFLGDQTTENGFQEFLEAAESVARSANLSFTFLGRFAPLNRQHSGAIAALTLSADSASLNFLADLGHAELMDYLRRPGPLVVMPRRRSGTLALLIESVALGVPVLLSDIDSHRAIARSSAGSSPLVAEDAGLANAIIKALRDPPRPELRFAVEESNAAFCEVLADLPPAGVGHDRSTDLPLVSVCLVHFKRPHFLEQALEGLSRQTCRDFEMILVDDGGEPEEVLSGLRRRLSTCPFPARLIATDNGWIGAARNAGAAVAKGEYLIFLDDDNIPMPHMVETMRAVARGRDLDIGTCLFQVLQGQEGPSEERVREVEYLPTGGPASAGLIENVFGDANAIIRKSVFESLGGFDPTPQVGAEDWDLFLRASLQGFRLEVIVEPLYFYRVHVERLNDRRHSQYKYYRRLLGRFLETACPRDENERITRLALGRCATDLITKTNAERNRHSPHGRLLKALDEALETNDAGDDYMLLGQLLRDLKHEEDGNRLISRGLESKQRGMTTADIHESPPRSRAPSPTKKIDVALLGRPKLISAQDDAYVRFDPAMAAVMVHPGTSRRTPSHPTIIEFPFELSHACRAIGVEIAVLHPRGPAVTLTLEVLRKEPVGTDSVEIGYRPVAHASKKIRPRDDWIDLCVNMPETSAATTPLRVRLTAETLRNNGFAWAYFRNVRIWYADDRL